MSIKITSTTIFGKMNKFFTILTSSLHNTIFTDFFSKWFQILNLKVIDEFGVSCEVDGSVLDTVEILNDVILSMDCEA